MKKKRKKRGVSDFVSGIQRVENDLILKIQHGLQGYIVKNIECESKERTIPLDSTTACGF